VGGEVRGNYATFNPLSSTNAGGLANGNLQQSGLTNSNATIRYPSSGKWYFEVTPSQKSIGYVIGIQALAMPTSPSLSNTIGIDEGGNRYNGNGTSTSSFLSAINVGDTLGVAVDRDANTINFYRNGTAGASNLSPSTLGADIVPFVHTNSAIVDINFGQRAFAYTAPSGFKSLCTQNLPAPLVTKSNTVMDVVTYTGNGGTQIISSLAFSPDFAWGKGRSTPSSHVVLDTIRGAGAKILYPNLTDAENAFGQQWISSFDSNGFTMSGAYNGSGETYVAWCWDAGTSTVSNTQGSITSQVRANATAGFSVVTYTGTGANATVGHGLGVAPGFIIIKNRSAATNWRVYHSALGNTKAIFLSTTGASDTSSVYWNNTSPTSTVFSVGSDDGANGNGNLMVAYAFSPVVGYNSFGSYTGNGSTDGPFVYTGMRPRWLLVKSSSYTDEWRIYDAVRLGYNAVATILTPNDSQAEATSGYPLDLLSNGFKLRGAGGPINTSGATYIYAAFAESPFQYARAR
jgi:hypothetical protein